MEMETTMSKTKTQPTFNGVGSLITYQDDGGANCCLGYLLCFKGHGVYDPHFGRVDVTPESAEIHNRLLDAALLGGLDRNCEIGMGGSFYVGHQDGWLVIKTWCGTLVSEIDAERQQRDVPARGQDVPRPSVEGHGLA